MLNRFNLSLKLFKIFNPELITVTNEWITIKDENSNTWVKFNSIISLFDGYVVFHKYEDYMGNIWKIGDGLPYPYENQVYDIYNTITEYKYYNMAPAKDDIYLNIRYPITKPKIITIA